MNKSYINWTNIDGTRTASGTMQGTLLNRIDLSCVEEGAGALGWEGE